MSNRKHAASVSHNEATIAELRADRGFAVEYLKSALEELDNPEHRAVGLLALRDVAEAYGGLATVAQEAGITREALYRALSPTGNPTLRTLLAVLHAVGMRLSVAPAEPVSAYNRSDSEVRGPRRICGVHAVPQRRVGQSTGRVGTAWRDRHRRRQPGWRACARRCGGAKPRLRRSCKE